MSVLGIILARKNSKRLPNKNMKLLCEKPLIEYTIDAAIESGVIDTLIVSTDDNNIIYLCHDKYKFIFIPNNFLYETKEIINNEKRIIIERPLYLATDNAPSEECILHAMDKVDKHDYVMVLQPTSPLRTSQDIRNCFDLCCKKNIDGIVSRNKDTKNQNGAIWITQWDYLWNNRKLLRDGLVYWMDNEKSIDIDNEDDFKNAELFIKEKFL